MSQSGVLLRLKKHFPAIGLAVVLVWGLYLLWELPSGPTPAERAAEVTKGKISSAMRDSIGRSEFPLSIQIENNGQDTKANIGYSLDSQAQGYIERLIRSYRPDYAAFVAVEADTGRILSLVSQTKTGYSGNLALKASFPAASLFKIVTATAALDQNKADPDTVIPFTGSNHTLYRRNLSQDDNNRWVRKMTLREAFAKSVNTVFAKLGVYRLTPLHLQNYAERFLFNESIASDVPVESGRFLLPENSPWAVAEAASGFNRFVTVSPLQGALMAAAAANDGTMMEPYIVESLSADDGSIIYLAKPRAASVAMSPETSRQLRAMMNETVARGTSRQAFRTLLRNKKYAGLEMGGKTGSLRSLDPAGKCDWFVGYAISDNRRIAVAALTVNEELWRVKSSFLARSYIEHYFRPALALKGEKRGPGKP